MSYSLNWDLESIFPGGSDSTALKNRMSKLQIEMKAYQEAVTTWKPQATTAEEVYQIIQIAETISNGLGQCISFVNALTSANVNDHKAKVLYGDLLSMLPPYQLSETIFYKKITEIEETNWQTLLQDALLSKVAFRLQEIRRDGKELLSEEAENIINTLSLDGINAWSSHYDSIVAMIKIPFIDDKGEEQLLSTGQAFNLMMGSPDADIRATLFEKWEAAWEKYAPLFADTLNHLSGFRLSNYQLHGDSNFLKKPLSYNRMQPETLQVMWETITKNKAPLLDFLTRKANLLGKEKMAWQDQDAPIILGTLEEKTYSFDEAADFIIKHFATCSPKMADFAKMAFEKQWIEAENRGGKRPGGYCTELPESKESRIFMTYNNSSNEVATLAHELGHAFHSSVLWDEPGLNREYAMNVAETASTFAELIVADATLKQATTDEEKINLLDSKIQNATAMFLNIHTRFIFETNYHQARQKGLVSEAKITEMMLAAQKESYQDRLASYHPHFWAAKLHFFIDDVPFYNFPYTFGYLFSMGIYAYASSKGPAFEDSYIALLKDTAAMTSEDLAKKHLGVDLTKADFWQAGIDMILKDIQEFMTLTEAYVNI